MTAMIPLIWGLILLAELPQPLSPIYEGNCPVTLYDPETVEIFHGLLLKQERIPEVQGLGHCVHYTLEMAEGERIRVILGPDWFVGNQNVPIADGQYITVKGSLVDLENEEVLMAAKVFVGDRVIVLRDEYGKPLWSQWRHGEWLFRKL